MTTIPEQLDALRQDVAALNKRLDGFEELVKDTRLDLTRVSALTDVLGPLHDRVEGLHETVSGLVPPAEPLPSPLPTAPAEAPEAAQE